MTPPPATHDAMAHTYTDWVTQNIQYIRQMLVLFSSLEAKVNQMSDILDTLKTDFEAYQTLVNTTLTGLQTTITNLTAGQLDPAKAAAVDAEIQAAIKVLAPPTPAPTS